MAYEAVAEQLLGQPGVSEGKMFGMDCMKAGGKVFAGRWDEDRLVVKLPRERVEELLASGDGEPFEPMAGRAMKEWVVVAAPEQAWPALAEEARRFVAGA
jgi:hypothetical protein